MAAAAATRHGAVCRLISLADFGQPLGFKQLRSTLMRPASLLSCHAQQQDSHLLQRQHQHQQRRGVISVPVQKGKVARAMRALNRFMYADNVQKLLRDKEVYTKPAKQRVIDAKEAKQRIQRQEFNEKLRWAMQRKAR